jgi:hypothetical protein
MRKTQSQPLALFQKKSSAAVTGAHWRGPGEAVEVTLVGIAADISQGATDPVCRFAKSLRRTAEMATKTAEYKAKPMIFRPATPVARESDGK